MATVQKQERLVMQESVRDDVVSHLQSNLTNLIDLALQLKQAHWNLIGTNFRSFHLQLDEILADVRTASDDVAERIAALGIAADGRSSTVAETSDLPQYDGSRQHVAEAINDVADRLMVTIQTLRKAIDALGKLDPISEDMLIGISAPLEKHLWMVQSQEL